MVLVECFVIFAEFSSFEPLVAAQYQAIATMFGLVFLNAMTCRVFRLLRISHENAYSQPTSMSAIRFNGCVREGAETRDI